MHHRRRLFARGAFRAEGFVVAIAAALVALCTGGLKATPYNNYVLLADAFNHGRVFIDWPGPWIDALAYGGRHYIIEGPFPALLLMPFVAIGGTSVSQTLLGVALCAVATGACWTLLTRMQVATRSRLLLTLFFFAGTDLWWCASLGYVWFVAHLAATAATMLALVELAGRRRPWLVAVLAICAAEARFTLVLALPVYAAMLLTHTSFAAGRSAASLHELLRTARENARRVLVPFLAIVAVAAALWVAYNLARWGLPYDVGYTAWYHQDSAGSPEGSPFALRYFNYEFAAFFLALPELRPAFPYLDSPIAGIGLPFTSPALVVALGARENVRLIVAMTIATLLVATPSFLYYVAGGAQFGMRHALDFEPFLLVLMALTMRRSAAWWQALLCFWSACSGAWGVWFWHSVIKG